jgi:soluble lytic murein transglycosylase-like protein
MQTFQQLQELAIKAAEAHGIDPALVCAVCHHESGNWKPYAVRYEPTFYGRYIVQMKLSETEKTLRATSFGLMQVMGQTAREFGFNGDYLTELLEPMNGIEYGCRKLARCLDQANGDVRSALLLYNGGGDKGYPDRVLQYLPRYKA